MTAPAPARSVEVESAAEALEVAVSRGDAEALRALAREGPIGLLPFDRMLQVLVYTPFRFDLACNPGLDETLRASLAEWIAAELRTGQIATIAADLVEILDDAGRPLPPAVIVPAFRIALSRPRTFGTDSRQRLARASLRYPDALTPQHLELMYEVIGRDEALVRQILEHPQADGAPGMLRRAAKHWNGSRDILELIASKPAARRDPHLLDALLTHRDPAICGALAAGTEPDECRTIYDRLHPGSVPHRCLAFLAAMPDEAWTRFTPMDLLPLLRHGDGVVRVEAQTLVCKLVQPVKYG